MVKELRIAGFKCFKDIKLELNNLTLFTGVNSAGNIVITATKTR